MCVLDQQQSLTIASWIAIVFCVSVVCGSVMFICGFVLKELYHILTKNKIQTKDEKLTVEVSVQADDSLMKKEGLISDETKSPLPY